MKYIYYYPTLNIYRYWYERKESIIYGKGGKMISKSIILIQYFDTKYLKKKIASIQHHKKLFFNLNLQFKTYFS